MTTPGESAATLAARARQGDVAAARDLVALLYPLVIKIVRAHRPRRMDEEDLAQTILARVFSALDQYLGKVPLEHWVSRVAVNTCYNALRAESVRPEWRWADLSEEEADFLEQRVMADNTPDPGDAMTARELAGRMLEALPPKDRLLLTLLDMEGRSINEIRELTGWSVAVIKVRAFRARLKLRKQFANLAQEARS
jgi:RNA polymerase sigma-70 factor (ECF subfamily)